MGLGKGGNYVYGALSSQLSYLRMSKEEVCFKGIIWGDKASHKGQDQFFWERGVLSV